MKKTKYLNCLWCLVFAALTMFFISRHLYITPVEPEPVPVEQVIEEQESLEDSIRAELVAVIDDYISGRAPSSKLTGEALVAACEKHDFDICFAIAQAEIESNLGTKGVAAKTNSPWNVGAYDGRAARVMNDTGLGYEDPNHAIEPYIRLVKGDYLVGDRDYKDLLASYTNANGCRYASNPNYEDVLARHYEAIVSGTDIASLQNRLKR